MPMNLDPSPEAEPRAALPSFDPGRPVLLGRQMPLNGYLGWKGVIDFCLAAVLLVAATPLLVLCALLVKLTSRGPAFYSQVRLGRGGLPYRIYKLRTMRYL